MVTEQWMLQTKRADFYGLAKAYHISPITARIIRNRGVVGEQAMGRYLYGTIQDFYDPHLLKDVDKAVEILKAKAGEGRRIRIIGDYDIDGVCSTYLLCQAMARIGAKADYQLPDRIMDGYGINEGIIRKAAQEGVDTIITCDNGIGAVEQVALAKKLGMTVLITDHHDILMEGESQVLPPADGIINPKQLDCHYPNKEICGAMVAFKLVQALYEAWQVPQEEWLGMMEFAAIATVGDVMRLQDENRIVVKEGLKRIGQTKNIGLKKLIEKNNLDKDHMTAYQIGFVIGPCLNAGGRLSTAKMALSLLLSKDEEEADRLAGELKELNDLRKAMTEEGTREAVEQVEKLYQGDKVLVVYLPQCHESLAGIIAGRLREQYQKPALVLTGAEGCIKGSGRSIEPYHMFQALVKAKDLLLKFGGHPMAAGFSLEEPKLAEFRKRLNEQAELSEEDFVRKLWIDLAMPLECIDEGLVQELELLEPFGQGNEKPQFALKDLHIRSVRVVGKNKNAVKLTLASPQGTSIDAMVFGNGEEFMEKLGDRRKIDVVYYPSVNEYQGNRKLQIVIKSYRW